MKGIGACGMMQRSLKMRRFPVAIKPLWMVFANCCSYAPGALIEPFHRPRNILRVSYERNLNLFFRDFNFNFL